MAVTKMMFRGKSLTIDDTNHDKVTVDVDGRKFECMHHHHDVGMPMWMCSEAYFAAFDLVDLAKHFAMYGYMFDDPNRIVCDDDGKVISPAPKKAAPKAATTKKAGK